MIRLTNTDVHGFDAAINGMRNPMNSWRLSDSFECKHYDDFSDWHDVCQHEECPKLKYIHTGPNEYHIECIAECEYVIGEEDLKLMHRLASAGDDHGKFARFINVTIDIVAPLYWWKEFDTYKVGTVSNSCSTMHKLMDKEFTLEDFSHEHLLSIANNDAGDAVFLNNALNTRVDSYDLLNLTVKVLNYYRGRYIKTKDKRYRWQLIQLLPSSYNQRRTVQLNYQVLNRIVNARQNHKLDEWHVFCDWALNLPYFKEIYGETQA